MFAGKAPDRTAAADALRKLLENGAALAKFRELIQNQGGDARVLDHPRLLPQALHRVELPAQTTGTVCRLDALLVGRAANALGAGRIRKEDTIDPAVGIELVRKVGESVEKGGTLAVLHVNGGKKNLAEARGLRRVGVRSRPARRAVRTSVAHCRAYPGRDACGARLEADNGRFWSRSSGQV